MIKGNVAKMSKTADARKQRSEKASRIIWKMEEPKFDWLRFPIASFFSRKPMLNCFSEYLSLIIECDNITFGLGIL